MNGLLGCLTCRVIPLGDTEAPPYALSHHCLKVCFEMNFRNSTRGDIQVTYQLEKIVSGRERSSSRQLVTAK
jgi:hypothetical protein